jgi:uncharacterized protein YjbJ (UPF0337 family)
MGTDQATGEWNVIKGKAKRIWGELTDDDFKNAEGSLDKLYGTIQKRFGDSKDKIVEKIKQIHM